MRELYVEELGAVRGGASSSSSDTTMACCEEGPLGCCDEYDWIWEAVAELLP
jgi:hypothetical protein